MPREEHGKTRDEKRRHDEIKPDQTQTKEQDTGKGMYMPQVLPYDEKTGSITTMTWQKEKRMK